MRSPAIRQARRQWTFVCSLAVVTILALTPFSRATAKAERIPLKPPPAMPLPDEAGLAPVRDIRMWYAIFNNDAEGTPVLLIHGGGAISVYWGEVVPALMDKHRVIVADTRGHGRSTRTKEPLSYAAMTDDYVALMDYLKIDKVALVGHSDGGIIGLEMAMRYPHRLSKLLAFGANYNVAAFKNDGYDPAQDPVFAAVAGHSRKEYERVSPTPTQFEALQKELFAMYGSQPDFKPEQLAKIRTPTVIMGAEQDEFIRREHTEELARLVPGAKLVMLRGVGHFAMGQDAAQFNREVLLFLESSLADKKVE